MGDIKVNELLFPVVFLCYYADQTTAILLLQVFTEDQFHVFRNQIRTLLNLGLRLKILSGQSKVGCHAWVDQLAAPQSQEPVLHYCVRLSTC